MTHVSPLLGTPITVLCVIGMGLVTWLWTLPNKRAGRSVVKPAVVIGLLGFVGIGVAVASFVIALTQIATGP